MFLVVATFALVGFALPTAVGGAILQPAAAQDWSVAEALEFAFDLADIYLDLVGTEDGGGDGGGDGANISQQDSNQDRTNRIVDSQGNVQRQSRQIVTDDGGGGNPGGP